MAKIPSQFPVGLRVLAIDDADLTVLENVKQMCNGCQYQVMSFSNHRQALNSVRENKDGIDLILIGVRMPNLEGYRLLRYIREEIDVPIIVMSYDDSVGIRMKAIENGACDYWKKPLHEDQIKNMWMHVARKAWNDNKLKLKLKSKSGSLEDDDDKKKRWNDESEVDQAEADAPPPSKKRRVIWAEPLHKKFVDAIKQLGITHAVPKKILEVMDVPDLTRENVASHLQKYRHQIQPKEKPKAKTTEESSRTGGRAEFEGDGGRVPWSGQASQTQMNLDGAWPPSMRQESNNNMLMMDTLQQQQQQESLIIMNHSIVNLQLQPSSMVVSGNNSPSVTATNFHGYTTPAQQQEACLTSANTSTPFPYSSRSASDSFYQDSLGNFRYDDRQMYNFPSTSSSTHTDDSQTYVGTKTSINGVPFANLNLGSPNQDPNID